MTLRDLGDNFLGRLKYINYFGSLEIVLELNGRGVVAIFVMWDDPNLMALLDLSRVN